MKDVLMVVRAELGCLQCGYDVGDVEGQRGAALEELLFLPTHQGDRLRADEVGRFQCPRCGGQVLPRAVTPVRHRLTPETLYEADVTEELGEDLAS